MTSKRTSDLPTSSATRAAVPAEPFNSPSSDSSIEAVVPGGDRRASLVAIRNRLATETSETLWQQHKNECECYCGMGDGRLLVALVKELRVVIAELEALPTAKEESPSDQLAARRAARLAGASGQ